MSKLAAAQALAERGFKVFPIKAGAKTPPLWKNWPERAAATVPANWPQDANIGIHCAGLLVLDVDVRSGGNETLATLDLPPTLTTLVPNGANKLGPGIDVKSTRGYVMAPGSEVPAGRYRFEADTPIADAPAWLLEQLGEYTPRERSEVREVPDAPPEVVERAREWLKTRPVGDEAFKTACGLRDFGLSEGQALWLLQEHDGRPTPTLYSKVEHAYRYAQNDPGSKAASAEDFPVVEAAPEKPRPKLLRLNELAGHPPGPYLIKGLLQRQSHAVLYGAPGAGKTFVALDLAFHVAAGKPWRERRVHKGVVLYLAYEGIGGLAKRAAALLHYYGNADVPLYVVGADYNLREKAGRQALAADLGQLPEKPVLVVIDTLARAMKGGDENSAQDMGALNDAVSALIQATGACVMLVHHSGKNKASGARGSSALLGAIDTEIEVDNRQIIARKQRDLDLAEPLGFRLAPVVIAQDADGEDLTSCVVEPAIPTSDRLAKVKGNPRLMFDELVRLSPDNEPVAEEIWRGACRAFLPEGKSAFRKAFHKGKRALERAGLLEQDAAGNCWRKME